MRGFVVEVMRETFCVKNDQIWRLIILLKFGFCSGSGDKVKDMFCGWCDDGGLGV